MRIARILFCVYKDYTQIAYQQPPPNGARTTTRLNTSGGRREGARLPLLPFLSIQDSISVSGNLLRNIHHSPSAQAFGENNSGRQFQDKGNVCRMMFTKYMSKKWGMYCDCDETPRDIIYLDVTYLCNPSAIQLQQRQRTWDKGQVSMSPRRATPL